MTDTVYIYQTNIHYKECNLSALYTNHSNDIHGHSSYIHYIKMGFVTYPHRYYLHVCSHGDGEQYTYNMV